ncbi:MAG: hypothetical protein ACFCU4_11715 [Puniceicoccaceae bacterium]
MRRPLITLCIILLSLFAGRVVWQLLARDLTFDELLNRPELWPLEVSLIEPHLADFRHYGTAERVPGDTVGLSEVYQDTLVAWDYREGRAFNLPVSKTDFVARANQLEREKPMTASRVARDLNKHLFSADSDGKLIHLPETTLNASEVIVFHYSDTFRRETFAIMPMVNQHYVNLRSRYPLFEMVFVSRDPQFERFRRFVAKHPPRFPILDHAQRRLRPTVLQHDAGTPPSFIAVDQHGRTILNSHPWNGPPVSPSRFFETLANLLEDRFSRRAD